MTYYEIVDYLYHLPRFTKGGHMENVKKLEKALGNPQDSFRYIHVAGTNGKGSVCAYIEHCLRLCHQKTGLFTSPHLVKVNERIRICGQEISDEDFVRIFHVVEAAVWREQDNGVETPSFFEYIYLMAMVYFEEQNIDFGIIEAGMGGRTDFTNAVEHPVLAVITAIGMDHVPLLGTNLEEIAREKSGIIKAGVPLVCAPQKAEAFRVLSERAGELGVTSVFLEKKNIEIISHNGKNIDFSVECGYDDTYNITLHTPAVYQCENAALALAALKLLWENLRYPGDFEKIVTRGISETRWPGRMEELAPDFYVDGAHNVDGAKALAQTLRRGFAGQPIYLVFAVAGDKDYEEMIRELVQIPELKGVIVTEIENGRRCALDKVVNVFKKNWNGMVRSTYNIKEAVKIGLLMRQGQGIVCCAGSLYLVGSIKEFTGGNSDDKL